MAGSNARSHRRTREAVASVTDLEVRPKIHKKLHNQAMLIEFDNAELDIM